MLIENPTDHAETLREAPFRAMFVADWVDATFIHYAVAPDELQPHVPFDLDTFQGAAYVSLVAFTQRRLRPALGGRLAEFLSAPLACHEFLNVRTYVRHGTERGIYFLAEWIPNRLAALLGPPMYGLPYRVGRLRYEHDVARGSLRGDVAAPGGRVQFSGTTAGEFRTAPAGTLDAFLIERYTAWTHRNGVSRRFRIRHQPWPQCRTKVIVHREDLLSRLCGGMLSRAAPDVAHFSPGVHGVEMSAPSVVFQMVVKSDCGNRSDHATWEGEPPGEPSSRVARQPKRRER